ncbi:hypothetical protein [Hydrogenophaga sp.]|uniref:hypothetical protein n=1 Tax=Hydrogenophaga sp. TaxID=1904254 RepID=UPI003F6B79AA
MEREELLQRLLSYLYEGGFPDNHINPITDDQFSILVKLIADDPSDIPKDLMAYYVVRICMDSK